MRRRASDERGTGEGLWLVESPPHTSNGPL